MRPRSIVQFERVYAASLVLGLLGVIILFVWAGTVPLRPNISPERAGYVLGITVAGVLLGLVIGLVFLYFIARRGSVMAKWIFVVFAALGILALLRNLTLGLTPHGLTGIIAVIQTVFQLVAIYLLFRPDSEAWFRARRG